jgi:hypothetical protein
MSIAKDYCMREIITLDQFKLQIQREPVYLDNVANIDVPYNKKDMHMETTEEKEFQVLLKEWGGDIKEYKEEIKDDKGASSYKVACEGYVRFYINGLEFHTKQKSSTLVNHNNSYCMILCKQTKTSVERKEYGQILRILRPKASKSVIVKINWLQTWTKESILKKIEAEKKAEATKKEKKAKRNKGRPKAQEKVQEQQPEKKIDITFQPGIFNPEPRIVSISDRSPCWQWAESIHPININLVPLIYNGEKIDNLFVLLESPEYISK